MFRCFNLYKVKIKGGIMDVSTVKPGNIVKVQSSSWYTKNSPQLVSLYEVKTVYNGQIFGVPLVPLGFSYYDKNGNRIINYPDSKNNEPIRFGEETFEVIA